MSQIEITTPNLTPWQTISLTFHYIYSTYIFVQFISLVNCSNYLSIPSYTLTICSLNSLIQCFYSTDTFLSPYILLPRFYFGRRVLFPSFTPPCINSVRCPHLCRHAVLISRVKSFHIIRNIVVWHSDKLNRQSGFIQEQQQKHLLKLSPCSC